MPTEMLTKEPRTVRIPRVALEAEPEELRSARARQRRRVHRLRLNAIAWALGTVGLTTLWVVHQWSSNGAFDRFGHEGDPGQWNPTLWALAIGIWTLVVGIMALQAYFERPVAGRPEHVGRLRFHVAAWAFGMVVLTPLWALIEWQDNGAFERFSNDSQPGEWDPWILVVGGIWAGAVVGLALWMRRPRRA